MWPRQQWGEKKKILFECMQYAYGTYIVASIGFTQVTNYTTLYKKTGSAKTVVMTNSLMQGITSCLHTHTHTHIYIYASFYNKYTSFGLCKLWWAPMTILHLVKLVSSGTSIEKEHVRTTNNGQLSINHQCPKAIRI